MHSVLLPLLLGAALHRDVPVPPPEPVKPFSFVVLGHLRGEEDDKLNPKLPELLERVRALKPDFAVLTGDLVWGDVHTDPVDSARVEREWNALDSALTTLGIPLYRVPGNHDISDLRSRDIYFRRYGRYPQVVTRSGSRLILLSSAWIPADGDTRHNPFVRPPALDSTEVAYLKVELAKPEHYAHTFVFMHHLLWWEPDAPWWRDVHPALATAGVQWVFGGDYGPLKFSHVERDGVHYVQASMEVTPTLDALRKREKGRILSSQFDNFLYVMVNGADVRVEVKTVAEFSTPMFTPGQYTAMTEPQPVSRTDAIRELVGSPKRIAALVGLVLLGFGAGVLVARRR